MILCSIALLSVRLLLEVYILLFVQRYRRYKKHRPHCHKNAQRWLHDASERRDQPRTCCFLATLFGQWPKGNEKGRVKTYQIQISNVNDYCRTATRRVTKRASKRVWWHRFGSSVAEFEPQGAFQGKGSKKGREKRLVEWYTWDLKDWAPERD